MHLQINSSVHQRREHQSILDDLVGPKQFHWLHSILSSLNLVKLHLGASQEKNIHLKTSSIILKSKTIAIILNILQFNLFRMNQNKTYFVFQDL